MAIKITEACINCGACEPACPNNAIYEGGAIWKWRDGTSIQAAEKAGTVLDLDAPHEPFSDEFYYIVSDKCTECVGFHETPQCAAVCPVDCCIPDLQHIETKEALLDKKKWLHGRET